MVSDFGLIDGDSTLLTLPVLPVFHPKLITTEGLLVGMGLEAKISLATPSPLAVDILTENSSSDWQPGSHVTGQLAMVAESCWTVMHPINRVMYKKVNRLSSGIIALLYKYFNVKGTRRAFFRKKKDPFYAILKSKIVSAGIPTLTIHAVMGTSSLTLSYLTC